MKCSYEECSNLVFGKYTFEDGEMTDKHLGYDDPVWEKDPESEDRYDRLEDALEQCGPVPIR